MMQDSPSEDPLVPNANESDRDSGPLPSNTLLTAEPAQTASAAVSSQAGVPEGSAEELHSRALALINEGKPADALPLLRRAVELNPDNPDYHHNLGVAHAHRGELDAAVACFRKALALKPEGTSALSNLGLALAQQGRLDEAVTAFEDCLRLQPESVDVLHRLANVYRTAKKPA